MRKIFAVLILFFIAISCVMEPPITNYTFKIINKTKTILLIESKQNEYTKLIYDTLRQNQVLIKEIPKLNCYKNYHDTLIHSFFQNLKIVPQTGRLNMDPYNRSNWTDSIKINGWHCKGGSVYYTLIIKEIDLKID